MAAQFLEQAQATAVQADLYHVEIQAEDFGDFFRRKVLDLVEEDDRAIIFGEGFNHAA